MKLKHGVFSENSVLRDLHIKPLRILLVFFLTALLGTVETWLWAGSQAGWPISNGSGLEAGFSGAATFADLDSDGDLEVVAGSRDGKVYAWHHDGTAVVGWPVITGSYVITSPAIGNLDVDTEMEVVFSSNDGFLYAVNHDGAALPGWPILADRSIQHAGGPYRQPSPALVDVDGDERLDVVFSSNEHMCTYAFNSGGQAISGWPQAWSGGEFGAYTPAVGDLDGDGDIEIATGVVHADGSLTYNKIYVWNHDGTAVDGWPIIVEDYYWSPFNSIVMADVDADGMGEIVAADAMNVYVFEMNGDMVPGWPHEGEFIDSLDRSLAIANLDDDRQLEIVVDYQQDLLVFDADGSILDLYPVSIEDLSWPAIADIDNDGRNEIIVVGGFLSGDVFAFNEDGTVVDGFPLATEGFTNSVAIILDLDSDGDLEVGVGSYGGPPTPLAFYMWDVSAQVNPNLMEWPMFRQDQYNSGYYTKRIIFADSFETGDMTMWSPPGPTQ